MSNGLSYAFFDNRSGAVIQHMTADDVAQGYWVWIRDRDGNPLVWVNPDGRLFTANAGEEYSGALFRGGE